jgi:polyisoprenoid-binding protein YceI
MPAAGRAVMGRRARVAAIGLLLAAAGARAEPVVYVFDPERSFVHFEIEHFGTSTIRGWFGPPEGHVELDRAARSGWVGAKIRIASVNTGMPAFDARLRAPDLLASDAFPEATFIGSRFVFDGDRLVAIVGELTLRGTSQGLELRARRFGCYDDPQLKREVCGGDFVGELKRGDFGASFGMPFVANRVRLVVQVAGLRR